MAVFFHNAPTTLKNRTALKTFLKSCFEKHSTPLARLDVIFCSDDYLLGINKQFLSHDYYTDIISFKMSEALEPLVAELYISLDRVLENAASRQLPLNAETHRVIFHGVLHFLGFNDKHKQDRQQMSLQEDRLLKKYLGSTWNN